MKQENTATDKLEQYPLRLPTELKSAMEEKAKKEKRSLNAQIILVLENYIEENSINPSGLKLAA